MYNTRENTYYTSNKNTLSCGVQNQQLSTVWKMVPKFERVTLTFDKYVICKIA